MKKQIIGVIVAVILVASYAGTKVYASHVATEHVDKAIADAANYAEIKYSNVSVDLLSLGTHISGIVISPTSDKEKKIHINEIVVYDFDKESDIPIVLDLAINGIKLEIEQKEAKKIKELGYTRDILLDFAIKLNYDTQKKELNLKKLTVGAEEVGELELNLLLGNIDFSSKDVLTSVLNPQISLHNASISYHDDSLTDRIFKQAAKKEGVSMAELKTKMVDTIQKKVESEADAFTKSALQELIVFINNPKSISITMTPEKPFSVGNLMQVNEPKDAVKLLNIQIKS